MHPNIKIVSRRESEIEVFQKEFRNCYRILCKHADIIETLNNEAFDCVILTGNSYGYPYGNISKLFNEYFCNKDTQESVIHRVQKHIAEHYSGEMPIGTAIIIDVSNLQTDVRARFVAYCPTMRLTENCDHSINAYSAFKAVLEQTRHIDIKTILCTPFCTGSGDMGALRSATQMHLAYRTVHHPVSDSGIEYAIKKEQELRSIIEA